MGVTNAMYTHFPQDRLSVVLWADSDEDQVELMRAICLYSDTTPLRTHIVPQSV